MNFLITEIEKDCQILLERALKGKSVSCFGIDGFGKYGASDLAKTFLVSDVIVALYDTNDNDWPDGRVEICLEGYHSQDCGHIITDRNFDISVVMHLLDAGIDPSGVTNAAIEFQEDASVILNFDVRKMMSW